MPAIDANGSATAPADWSVALDWPILTGGPADGAEHLRHILPGASSYRLEPACDS